MTSSGYTVASLEELTCDEGFAPIRLALGVRSFGMSAWIATEAGSELVPEHDEAGIGHEELYVVIKGHAAFTVGGDEIDAPTGTIVFVKEPGTVRAATAIEAGTTLLAVGGKPTELRKLARDDSDLESLRVDPRFEPLLG